MMQIPGFPQEVDVLGAYTAAALTGTMAAAMSADSDVFQFRWSHSKALAVITDVWCGGLVASDTAFATGFGAMRMLRATAWTVAPSGGSAVTPTPMSPRAGASLVLAADLRGPSTAALTGGTRVNAASSMGYLSLTFDATANRQFLVPQKIFEAKDNLQGALILGELEGWAIKATVTGTGTWQASWWTKWIEVMPRY